MGVGRKVWFVSAQAAGLDGEVNTEIQCRVLCAALLSLAECVQPTAENNTNPYSPCYTIPLQLAVLEVNLLPASKDEVHLIVHTNGPHKAFKMIE